MTFPLSPFSLDRMERAVDKVRQRLLKATSALNQAGVPYAVLGGHAVAAWVSRVDETAVRITRDVDILIQRQDLDRMKSALQAAGFLHRHTAGMDLFLDGPDARARDAVHVVFAGEKVRPEEPLPNPAVEQSVEAEGYRVISLPALVQIKLTAFRDKDRTHLRDLIEVGLLDESWCANLPEPLGARLRQLIETPNG